MLRHSAERCSNWTFCFQICLRLAAIVPFQQEIVNELLETVYLHCEVIFCMVCKNSCYCIGTYASSKHIMTDCDRGG